MALTGRNTGLCLGLKVQHMTTAAEEKICAFCARCRLKCEWQDLMNLGERTAVKTLNCARHTKTLKVAQRIKEVCVIDWSCDDGGSFSGRIFSHGAFAIVRITQAECNATGNDFKGVWHDYYVDRPEWRGCRTAMIAEYGTRLFIEGA